MLDGTHREPLRHRRDGDGCWVALLPPLPAETPGSPTPRMSSLSSVGKARLLTVGRQGTRGLRYSVGSRDLACETDAARPMPTSAPAFPVLASDQLLLSLSSSAGAPGDR